MGRLSTGCFLTDIKLEFGEMRFFRIKIFYCSRNTLFALRHSAYFIAHLS